MTKIKLKQMIKMEVDLWFNSTCVSVSKSASKLIDAHHQQATVFILAIYGRNQLSELDTSPAKAWGWLESINPSGCLPSYPAASM